MSRRAMIERLCREAAQRQQSAVQRWMADEEIRAAVHRNWLRFRRPWAKQNPSDKEPRP